MKMPLLALCATLALAACSSTPPTESASSSTPAESPAMPSTTTPPMLAEDCKAEPAQQFVGKVASAEVAENARIASDSKTVRVIKPGMAVTMDYRGDRLNINVDAANKIASVNCG